jgi:N-acetylglutamate synthase-like GNAT family acetyltransferase
LEAAKLPLGGVAELGDRLLVADAEGELVGCAGLEIYGSVGLLRSAVVASSRRGEGLGVALTRRLLDEAAARGLARVYLLTETAAGFFERLGFARIDRDAVEDAVRASTEFAHLCPASAQAMVREVGAG